MLFRRLDPVLKNYVSDTDCFLQDFDHRSEASSESRRQEEQKYRMVAEGRDNPKAVEQRKQIWEDF